MVLITTQYQYFFVFAQLLKTQYVVTVSMQANQTTAAVEDVMT